MRTKNPEYYSRIINYIDEYKEANGFIPTNAKIAEGVSLSTATVSRYLTKLEQDGKIQIEGHRCIRTDRMKKSNESTTMVPLVGEIACGIPILAEENIVEYVRMPKSFIGDGIFYFLKAIGKSMIEVGIDEGDLVLVKKQDTANRGQIVVALVENEATLKRYFPEKDGIRLHPENRDMSDIIVKDCIIQGVATKVIKDIE